MEQNGLKLLDHFLKNKTYLTGNNPTIADLQFYFETTNLIEFDQ